MKVQRVVLEVVLDVRVDEEVEKVLERKERSEEDFEKKWEINKTYETLRIQHFKWSGASGGSGDSETGLETIVRKGK